MKIYCETVGLSKCECTELKAKDIDNLIDKDRESLILRILEDLCQSVFSKRISSHT